jgi:comEA protein
MKKKEEFSFSDFIFKNRVILGSVLIVLNIAAGSYLLWRENYWKPRMEEKLALIERKVEVLESGKVSANANPVNIDEVIASISDESKTEEGVVAGASTNPANESKSTQNVSALLNINAATQTQLEALPGIGPVYAKRIIEYRDQNSGFKSIDEVKKVKGIGDKTFQKFKDKITVN